MMDGERRVLETALAKQLAFTGLGDADPAVSRDLWLVIEPEIDAILTDFYARLERFSKPDDFARMDVSRLIEKQKAHWGRLFYGSFASDYVDGVLQVGMVHNRIGLEPEWYVGGYVFFLNRMTSLILDHFADAPETARDRVLLLNRLVGLDMGVALSVYQPEWT